MFRWRHFTTIEVHTATSVTVRTWWGLYHKDYALEIYGHERRRWRRVALSGDLYKSTPETHNEDDYRPSHYLGEQIAGAVKAWELDNANRPLLCPHCGKEV